MNEQLLREQLYTAIRFFNDREAAYSRARKYDEAEWDETSASAYASVLAALDAEEHR